MREHEHEHEHKQEAKSKQLRLEEKVEGVCYSVCRFRQGLDAE